MSPSVPEAKAHYDRFLAEHYLWMAGGYEGNTAKSRQFFSDYNIRPESDTVAIDLGAGCGFQSIPLAEAGFRVTAVDFCQPLLDELSSQAPTLGIEAIAGDILDFSLWTDRQPELITCMGDTITHLPDHESVSRLIRQCHAELVSGGSFVLSLRDYSGEENGNIAILPVRRDADRIFLCRLEYRPERVLVTDILFSRMSGAWERSASEYAKLRLAPAQIREMVELAGFRIDLMDEDNGMIVFIGVKSD